MRVNTFNLFSYLILIFNLVIPFNTIPKSEILLLIGLFFLALELIYKENLNRKKYLILLVVIPILVVYGFARSKILIVSQVTYFTLLFVFLSNYKLNNDNLKLSKTVIKFIIYCAILSMSYQFITTPPTHSGRLNLSVEDPNFSGFLILILFFISIKTRTLPGIIFCFFCLFLIESRNFLLAITLFTILIFTKDRFHSFYKKIFTPFNLIVTGNALLFLFSFYWISNFIPDVQRIDLTEFNFNDNSNFYRFLWNVEAVLISIENESILLFGGGEFGVKPMPIKPPHSSFFQYLLFLGLPFTMISIAGIIYLIKLTNFRANLHYLIPAIFYSYFLHSLYYMSYFTLIIIVLILKEYKNGRKIYFCTHS